MPNLIVRPNGKGRKLYGIDTIVFGLSNGATCRWKTPVCSKLCYGQHGRYDPRNPTFSAQPLARLAFAERMPAQAYYNAIMAIRRPRALRLGQMGDIAKPDVCAAVVQAILERPDVPFMWPTRAWREPKHMSWQILARYLPGGIHLSTDATTDLSRVPYGWPRAHIADQASGFRLPDNFIWCPHYLPKQHEQAKLPAGGKFDVAFAEHTPHAAKQLAISSMKNCIGCMICYGTPARDIWGADLPDVVADLRARTGLVYHGPTMGQAEHAYDIHESASPDTYGYMTEYGWYNPFDDA